jgi:hypothetical protein
MEVDEVKLVRESLRVIFAEGRAKPDGIAAALSALGWDEVVAEAPAALGLLFEEHGRALAVTRLLDDVVLTAAGLEPADGMAVVYPLPGPGPLLEPVAATAGKVLAVNGVVRAAGGNELPESVLVPASTESGTELFLVPGVALAPQAAAGLDHGGGWFRIRAELDPALAERVSGAGAWIRAVTGGRRALAAELIGLAGHALDVAVNHVTSRRQFGRPVGSFQAVRFRLAEAKVAIESAAEVLRLSFADPDPLVAAVAKALAGAGADKAVRQAMQVCGAMGLTWEFPLHDVFRRSAVLDGLLGHADGLTTALGRHVIDMPDLPQLEPLGVPLAF